MTGIYLALVHHPVRARDGATITTAITNLDVHDIARSCRTYGVARYFVVTPVDAQLRIAERILEHWRSGPGLERIPERGRALALVESVRSLADAVSWVEANEGRAPVRVATAARSVSGPEPASYDELRALDQPLLLVFGTGHGLADEALAMCQRVLPPIRPGSDFNHLSVRAAVAIVLDRLIGEGPHR